MTAHSAACRVVAFEGYSGGWESFSFLAFLLDGWLLGGGLCVLWRSSGGFILPHAGSEGMNKKLPDRSLGCFLPTCAPL